MEWLGLAMFVGSCYGLWPAIASFGGGLPPALGVVVMAIGNVAIVTPLFLMNRSSDPPTPRALWCMAIAAVLDGLGKVAFMRIVKTVPKERFATANLTVIITQVALSVLFAWAILGWPITLRKAGGVAAAIAAILLLT